MKFSIPKETYTGKIPEIVFGKEKKAYFGGESALPFHFFEGEFPHKPLIAFEIQDDIPEDYPEELAKVYSSVWDSPVKWAKFCETLGAEAIALRLMSTHPDSKDSKPEEAADKVKKILSEIDLPLIILGSNHSEKDAEVLPVVSDASRGYNCIIGKAQEGNYKTITASAMAGGHSLIAMSELDVNLAKQLNILITQMDFPREKIIIDPMCSALGYGFEYTYSVMERIRIAGQIQGDNMLCVPMVADVGFYVWKTKESQASESDIPEWGSLHERAVMWEAVTACSFLLSGAELLIMRHPEAINTVKRFIGDLFS
ncbi:acetyl-CoA decarbonylase/synthase complex subunit delta [Thermodesulfovibrio yellowstonii]|uniref:Corrinoid/iron-sulfur protein, small subunit n=1 Tax=Thermodesulfovibrio yellowstonii (strain ATCC 51303 / DSM 11347 / YP87) TaxID=289376 RepID=B5YG71_THEYD|nr:acetyl-CoA decarbonylase/synthase complex subunit delta [Thermodesulfovibrio yellowstonii]ACI20890.1 corrinoid/iron-sulfur protein, small subunit [Thermodesulfovibrio yellowstonii DSM 11347]